MYGIRRSEELMSRIELTEDYPSKIAGMLVDGSIDAGLVPVAVIPKLNEWHIVSDFCIGATGDVASVCLFSQVPLSGVEKVLLDYQSRTSVNLAKILLKYYWKKEVQLEDARENYISDIKDSTAGVVIGDRALAQRKISPYIYDLAGNWNAFTGLPFVFAAWIANKQLPPEFIDLFNRANAVGLEQLDKVIAENPYSTYDLHTYYTKNISYRLTNDKINGMHRFLALLEEMDTVAETALADNNKQVL